ncbi:hypothetical protein N0V83_004362 [Neocucurbitaria cava]|uniref:3-dehydroquinate dehydratase n=1 Tax=Neocucurbitaria cava TaxID=798079 RepID=A0A9W9CMX8_9PLEO|nr:hypothetical protein N0V83_004362 [Neocucurbitaria cava]
MPDIIFDNFAAKKQTFIIPLTFTDITAAKDVITRIGYGGDIWELRVDLLSPAPGPLTTATNLPSPDYVEAQIKALQRMSDLPILFTIRTKSQGGKFPDDAAKEALELMLLAVSCGIQYIDVEVEWPQSLLGEITEKKGSTKVVASYHSWTGNIRWTSEELQKRFESANKFGDIIKLSILSATLEDCFELGLFVRDYNTKFSKPLLAVGMGAHGQLSRITSPISLVTHPLIPFPSAPGQLSLAQVHQAQHLMGMLPRREFNVFGEKGESAKAAAVAAVFQQGFQELGLPHVCQLGGESGASASGFDVANLFAGGRVEDAFDKQFSAWTGRQAPSLVLSDAWKRSLE